jgi:PAS domain S-box-containing protein
MTYLDPEKADMLRNIELWKLAVDKNPEAIAFVGIDDKFLYANMSWCKMVGYASNELAQMTWQDITCNEDIGGDGNEVKAVKDGIREDYYFEKNYVRKSGSRIQVGLYIVRYPEYGNHIGYVAFAKELSHGHAYNELKERFLELESIVKVMQHNEITAKLFAQRIDSLKKDIDHNQEILKTVINSQSNRSGTSFNLGDRVSGSDNTSRSTVNDSKVMLFMIAGFGFLCTALISVAAVLAYLSYTNADNPSLQPPNINQPVLSTKQ